MMNNRNNDKNAPKRFEKISIGLASPESILAESRGEVLKPETIFQLDRKSTHLNSSHSGESRMPSSA